MAGWRILLAWCHKICANIFRIRDTKTDKTTSPSLLCAYSKTGPQIADLLRDSGGAYLAVKHRMRRLVIRIPEVLIQQLCKYHRPEHEPTEVLGAATTYKRQAACVPDTKPADKYAPVSTRNMERHPQTFLCSAQLRTRHQQTRHSQSSPARRLYLSDCAALCRLPSGEASNSHCQHI